MKGSVERRALAWGIGVGVVFTAFSAGGTRPLWEGITSGIITGCFVWALVLLWAGMQRAGAPMSSRGACGNLSWRDRRRARRAIRSGERFADSDLHCCAQSFARLRATPFPQESAVLAVMAACIALGIVRATAVLLTAPPTRSFAAILLGVVPAEIFALLMRRRSLEPAARRYLGWAEDA